MSSKILKKLHEDAEVRKTFQDLLAYLMHASVPQGQVLKPTSLSSEEMGTQFDSQLTALVNLQRAIDVQENETKIGHWCDRENEVKVKGMDEWSVYWLSIRIVSGDEPEPLGVTMHLTLWAVGKDDNTIQKAIKVWVETHFPAWKVEKLQCVRR